MIQAIGLNNTVGQWLGFFLIMLACLLLCKPAASILRRQAQRLADTGKHPVLAGFLASLARPAKLFVFSLGAYAASTFMELTIVRTNAAPIAVLPLAGKALMSITLGWFLYRLVDLVEYPLRKLTDRADSLMDRHLVPLIQKILRVAVIIMAILFVAQNIFPDLQLGPLIAGLGIGGVAVALAAQSTLSNFFGSVMIFADRPFRLGELVKVKGYFGRVLDVGFRSTRMQTLDGNIVTIPNSVVANESVENLGPRPHIRRVMDLTLIHEKDPDKIQRAITLVIQLLAESKEHLSNEPPRAYVTELAADGAKLQIYYWFAPPQYWRYMEFNHTLNMELLRRFSAEGIAFTLQN